MDFMLLQKEDDICQSEENLMKKACLSIKIMKKYIKLIKRFTLLHL